MADNSDDEKHLFKAEMRAGRKTSRRVLKRSKRRAVPPGSPATGNYSQALPDGLRSMLIVVVLQQYYPLVCSYWYPSQGCSPLYYSLSSYIIVNFNMEHFVFY